MFTKNGLLTLAANEKESCTHSIILISTPRVHYPIHFYFTSSLRKINHHVKVKIENNRPLITTTSALCPFIAEICNFVNIPITHSIVEARQGNFFVVKSRTACSWARGLQVSADLLLFHFLMLHGMLTDDAHLCKFSRELIFETLDRCKVVPWKWRWFLHEKDCNWLSII